MTDRQDIDAGIDAALATQLRAPQLDRQFDAAVWRRIEAVERQVSTPVAPPRSTPAVRWLRAGNAVGIGAAAVLAVYFSWPAGGGMALASPAAAAPEQTLFWLTPASWVITACALAFGLRFTSLGRWLRAELS